MDKLIKLEDAVVFLYELSENDALSVDVQDKLYDIYYALSMYEDFDILPFGLPREDCQELYVSIRSDLVEEKKQHEKKVREFIRKNRK